MSEHNEHISALSRQYRRLRGLYLACLVAAVLALVFYFVDKRLSMALVALSLLGHLLVVRPRSRAYQRAFLHACGQCTLEKHLQSAVHTAQPTLDAADLRRARLIAANPDKGGVLIREGGAGTYRGRAVRLGDATFAHSFPMPDGKTHHQFVTGTWVTVELERDTGLDWRLLSPKAMMAQSRAKFLGQNRDLEPSGAPVPRWIETEDCTVLHAEDTPHWPGEAFLGALRTLQRDTEMPLAVCVQGDRLHTLVVNRILGQKVSSRVPPSDAIAKADFLPELDGILRLSDKLMD